MAFFLVFLSAIAFNRCNPYDTVTSPAPAIVPVTEVRLDKTTLLLAKGVESAESATLEAAIKPENATNQNISWESDKHAVATVDDEGKVTAVAEGTATITVTTKDGDKNAKCTVTVFEMVPVKAGTFQMGSNDGKDNEKPVHQVTLTQDYYIGKFEVTQALWQAVMGQRPTSDGSQWSSSYGMGDNYPAYFISWEDIQGFLTALNAATASQRGDKTFAMPTEAQWEFAARGGNSSHGYKYSGSDDKVGDVAWYYSNSAVDGTKQTHPVGQMQPNELGIYDMSGNVWEWCADWYDAGYYAVSPVDNPQGPTEGGSYRVFRGGGCSFSADGCSVSYRNKGLPDFRSSSRGFRLALLP